MTELNVNGLRILVTGSAGFIGFHLSDLLLKSGAQVLGFDAFTDYYDVRLKRDRVALLSAQPKFKQIEGELEDAILLNRVADEFKPQIIVHLAAQAGVRYSLENPRAYINSNIVGTFNVMEVARQHSVEHLLMASTSSVYGANTDMPFEESQKTEHPLTIYAATKKANEVMAHSYAHLHQLPTTLFRFFTVYGPWGRPDMALFKFTKGILEGDPIDVYNEGEMHRDFTFVTDLACAIALLIPSAPSEENRVEGDTLSPVAPHRVVNIGNSNTVKLTDFIEAIESSLNKKATIRWLPMQQGDVPATWADASLLSKLTGYAPRTDYKAGVAAFVQWYQNYYQDQTRRENA